MYSTFLNWFWFHCCLSNVPSFYLVLLIFVNLSTDSESGTSYNKKVEKVWNKRTSQIDNIVQVTRTRCVQSPNVHDRTCLHMIDVVDDFQAKWLMVNHRIIFLSVPASVVRHFNKWLVCCNHQLRTGSGTEQSFKRMCRPHQLKMARAIKKKWCHSDFRGSNNQGHQFYNGSCLKFWVMKGP